MSTSSTAPFCPGWSSRLAIGALWLSALGVASSGRSLIPALPIAALAATLGGYCSRELRPLDTAPGRNIWRFARHWCLLLSLLGALAGAARALGGTLDALSGGRARHWLFGEVPPPPTTEPWPDPLAVAALAILCLMFMSGLENNQTFTILLVGSVASGVLFFTVSGSFEANPTIWMDQLLLPDGWNGFITSAATCIYAFPASLPITGTRNRKLKCFGLVVAPLVSMMVISTIFSLMIPYREYSDSAVPLIQVFETHRPAWASPGMASFTVVALSLAMCEVLPDAVSILIVMASSEWKVLTKVLAYESTTTGSQVLAVFSAGSLAAILAFACPMAHLVKLTSAGQVLVWIMDAVLLLHLRSQPEHQVEDPGDVRYKRLAGATSRTTIGQPSRSARLAAGLWFLPRSVRQQPQTDHHKIPKGKAHEERECLLLDEYASIRPSITETDISDQQSELSDHAQSSSDGESSTDIDAVVKEYKDRIMVVSSVPDSSGNSLGVPSLASGKRATAGALIVFTLSQIISIGIAAVQPIIVYAAIPIFVGGTLLCWWQPVRTPTAGAVSCSFCCLLCSILAAPLVADAWPAIVMFTAAGLLMYARRSTFCGAIPKRRNRPPPLLGPRQSRLTHLDTVYIAR